MWPSHSSLGVGLVILVVLGGGAEVRVAVRVGFVGSGCLGRDPVKAIVPASLPVLVPSQAACGSTFFFLPTAR